MIAWFGLRILGTCVTSQTNCGLFVKIPLTLYTHSALWFEVYLNISYIKLTESNWMVILLPGTIA